MYGIDTVVSFSRAVIEDVVSLALDEQPTFMAIWSDNVFVLNELIEYCTVYMCSLNTYDNY